MIIKYTIRNIMKRPFLSLVIIIGLSLALSGVLLPVFTFAATGFTALFIVLLSVSQQSWIAASTNPVEAFRYE